MVWVRVYVRVWVRVYIRANLLLLNPGSVYLICRATLRCRALILEPEQNHPRNS